MANITPKENYLRLSRGEMPEYVPVWDLGFRTPNSPVWSVSPSIMGPPMMGPPPSEGNTRAEWTDAWGITRTAVEEAGNAGLPKPGHFILDDVTKWDKAVKWPEYPEGFESADWGAMAASDLKDFDREMVGVSAGGGFGPFTMLISYMGFTEGLCALLEEPEAVKEMLDHICSYYMPIIEKVVEHYKPDIFTMGDDTAAKYAPFFSVEVYQDIFKPIYARMAKPAVDRGIPIQFHNCGKCEAFIPDMIDFGVKYWDPAQESNDLVQVMQEYKGQITVVGGFDFVPETDSDLSEEKVRAYARTAIDKYAPGGGYIFCGGIVGRASDIERTTKLNAAIQDEVKTYGGQFYMK
ncbi:MAG: veratrol--corrinoid protein metyltransferase [Eubacteriaceae bacterium]|nr:veratrol--corrinoid protein metyltransferase [Eubacteriaceae bacterium]